MFVNGREEEAAEAGEGKSWLGWRIIYGPLLYLLFRSFPSHANMPGRVLALHPSGSGAPFSFPILLFSPRDGTARWRYLVCARIVSSLGNNTHTGEEFESEH